MFLIFITSLWIAQAQAAVSVRDSNPTPLAAHSLYEQPLRGQLKRQVDFWIDIYSKYGTNESVIHDTQAVNRVYEVVPRSQAQKARAKWRAVLLSLHQKQVSNTLDPQSLTEDEKKVFELFGSPMGERAEPDMFLSAAHRKRLRSQAGQRENFLSGLREAGRYLPIMEEVFRAHGLPTELTRLPFVESSFNVRARSKVGASGIWQFMPSTGRLFLRVDDRIDERNDPIRATEAAAQLLKLNYQSLGTWPLAVTAYNHGRKGMMRAVRRVGSMSFEDLLALDRNRSFGFASRNFYSCLLAAIHVQQNASRYFGDYRQEGPLSVFEVPIPSDVNLKELISLLRLPQAQLQELNPAVSADLWKGKKPLPEGYRLRLPAEPGRKADQSAGIFLAQFEAIPAIYKGSTRASNSIYPERMHSDTRQRSPSGK